MNKEISTSTGDHVEPITHEHGLEAKLQALQAKLVEGEMSGASKPLDFEAFIVEKSMPAPGAD